MHTYIQELQEAMAMSSKTKSSLSVLMSVSAATNKWLKRAGEGSEASAAMSTFGTVPASAPAGGKAQPAASPGVSGDAKPKETQDAPAQQVKPGP
jgi:hypothetical protein